MLDTTQLDDAAFRVDMPNAMRPPAFGDGCNAVLIPLTLADLPNDGNPIQIRSASASGGYWQAPGPTQWPDALGITFADSEQADIQANIAGAEPTWSAEHPAHEGQFNLVQIQPYDTISIENFSQDEYSNLLLPTPEWAVPPTGELIAREVMRPKPRLDFFCEAAANKLEVFAAYIAESARQAGEFLKRFYRNFIVLSVAASKCGYSSLCIGAAARDHVVHLEMITLAKEHEEGPGSSVAGQILTFGEESWTRIKRSCSNLFSDCSAKVLRFGSIGVGLNDEAL